MNYTKEMSKLSKYVETTKYKILYKYNMVSTSKIVNIIEVIVIYLQKLFNETMILRKNVHIFDY